jgi:hypothetical protein
LSGAGGQCFEVLNLALTTCSRGEALHTLQREKQKREEAKHQQEAAGKAHPVKAGREG